MLCCHELRQLGRERAPGPIRHLSVSRLSMIACSPYRNADPRHRLPIECRDFEISLMHLLEICIFFARTLDQNSRQKNSENKSELP